MSEEIVAVPPGAGYEGLGSPMPKVSTPPARPAQQVAPVLTPTVSIATLPAVAVVAPEAYPVSERTGEPRRPPILLAAVGAAWLSVAVTIAAFGWWWWQAATIKGLSASARLLTWTNPDPVSGLAIAMVMVIAVIGVLMVAAGGVVAYNAWAGQGWVRVAGLVCLGITGLSFLVSWWLSAAMIPLAIAVALLWLPPVKPFMAAMAAVGTSPEVVAPTTGIKYGPQPLIGEA